MIVRSIDVGYGFTKYIKNDDTASGIPEHCSFPSVVVPLHTHEVKHQNTDIFLNNHNVYTVPYGNLHALVGPDIQLNVKTLDQMRTNLDNFSTSHRYHALISGAIQDMNIDKIDVLALGLPVDIYKNLKDTLISLFTGNINVGINNTISINKVLVFPQPLGGLASTNHKPSNTTLLIDPGYNTLDWLVSKNFKINKQKSGSCKGGMSYVIDAIATLHREVTNDPLPYPTQIENAIIDHKKLLLVKNAPTIQNICVTDYYPHVAPIVDEFLSLIEVSIGDISNIDRILLVGGGSKFYKGFIEQRFPQLSVKTVKDAEFSNVKGFQLLANRYADDSESNLPTTELKQKINSQVSDAKKPLATT